MPGICDLPGADPLCNAAGDAIGDAASAAHRLQKVPSGFYNLEVMLGSIVKHSGDVGVCGTCMDARGISADDLITGAHRSSMDELTQWTAWADKVLVF